MKKLILTLGLLLLSFNARAEESIILPDCDDEYLLNKVIDKVKDYQTKDTADSVIEKRKQKLILKNMETFKEIPHANFTSKDDFATANRILMTKINKSVDEDNMRLCQNSSGGIASQVYLLIYYKNGEYSVDITNIAPPTEEFSIIY